MRIRTYYGGVTCDHKLAATFSHTINSAIAHAWLRFPGLFADDCLGTGTIPPAPSTRLRLPLHIIATGRSTPSPSPTDLPSLKRCGPGLLSPPLTRLLRREQQGRYLDGHVRRVRKHGGFCLCELQVQAGTAVSRLLVVVWSPPSLLTLQSIRDEEFTFENNVIC